MIHDFLQATKNYAYNKREKLANLATEFTDVGAGSTAWVAAGTTFLSAGLLVSAVHSGASPDQLMNGISLLFGSAAVSGGCALLLYKDVPQQFGTAIYDRLSQLNCVSC